MWLVRLTVLAALTALVTVAVLAADFTWIGGSGQGWQTCANWSYSSSPPECYPSASTDNVIIPSGTSTIDLTAEELGEMRIEGSVTFGATNTVTFVSEGIVLDADAGAITLDIDNTSGQPIIYLPSP